MDRQARPHPLLCVGEGCSTEERESFLQYLLTRHQVFTLSDIELAETDLVQHRIEMKESVPFRAPPQRLPYALRSELEAELIKLEATGCIEASTSPFASGLVLIRKKDGGLRVCVDYRGINKDTIPDRYPIPCIDDLIDTVGRQQGKLFTALDLMKGYHQIKMHQEHLEHADKVLTQLNEAGLRLKPSKCRFAQERVEYLGHTLTSAGVSPNDRKVQAMKDFLTPKCCKDVKSFLGLVNFTEDTWQI